MNAQNPIFQKIGLEANIDSHTVEDVTTYFRNGTSLSPHNLARSTKPNLRWKLCKWKPFWETYNWKSWPDHRSY